MGNRYRVSVDLCEEDLGNITSDILREAADAAVSAVKLSLTPELKKVIKVESVAHQYGVWYHHHQGTSSCTGCIYSANDGKDGDMTEVFPARPNAF